MKAAAKNAGPLNLVAGSIGVASLDATGFSLRRLTTAIEELMATFGHEQCVIGDPTRSAASHPDWIAGHAGDLVCLYTLEGYGTIRLAFPQRLFLRLFECFFGGTSASDSAMVPSSRAQARFAERLARACAPIMKAGWTSLADIDPHLVEWGFEAGDIVPTDDGMIILDVPIGRQQPDESLSIALPAAIIAAMRRQGQAGQIRPVRAKTNRREIFDSRFSHVRLPVRSILARPEMPASRLLTLKIGDFLPIAFPASVPVLIGQHLIAQGRLGESDGRAAIRIESMAKGSSDE